MGEGVWGRESGQAAVEAALVLPLMITLALGLIQLTWMHQAKLFTRLAAYSAARTGIVWNGNAVRMREAAMRTLLPTRGIPGVRREGWLAVERSWSSILALDRAFQAFGASAGTASSNVPLHGLVRIDTLNPRAGRELPDMRGRWSGSWEEFDFDAATGVAEGESLDRDRRHVREANLLHIRVRYWFELRVPLANAMLFAAWKAVGAGQGGGDSSAKAFPTATNDEVRGLETLAEGGAGVLGPGPAHRYFLPLEAEHLMRMQSNFHRRWAVHP